MISPTPTATHAFTQDYFTFALTLIFITYCHFFPPYLILSISPNEDYNFLLNINRKLILSITPEPFLSYYTTLHNNAVLLNTTLLATTLLCITLSPYRQPILRPSALTSLGIYIHFIITIQLTQAILILLDNIAAPLFPIILFIALKSFNPPSNTYIRQFTMIRNEVHWVPDQLIPRPPLSRLIDPYYYTSQPYRSLTPIQPSQQKSVLLEPNFIHNQHLAEQYRTLRQSYILPYLVPTACPSYAHYCCQIHYTTVADTLEDRLYSITTLTPNFLAPKPLYDFPTPMFTAQFNQTNPPLGPLPFTFYATPLAILNFCTTGPHTDQDPTFWQQYVHHYLRPLSTFIDAITLERDFLVAAAKATNWAPHFPYMEFTDFRLRYTQHISQHTHSHFPPPPHGRHPQTIDHLNNRHQSNRTQSEPVHQTTNPMSPSRSRSHSPPPPLQPRRSERLRQRREQISTTIDPSNQQNINPNIPIRQTNLHSTPDTPPTPNFPSHENVLPTTPIVNPTPTNPLTVPLSPHSPSSHHSSNSTDNEYPTSLPPTPHNNTNRSLVPTLPSPIPSLPIQRMEHTPTPNTIHHTDHFLSPHDSNTSGYNTVRTQHYSIIHTTTMEPRNSLDHTPTHPHSLPFSHHSPTPLTQETPSYPSLDPPRRNTFNTTTNHLSALAPSVPLNHDGAQALTNLLNTLGPNLAPDNKQIDFRQLTQTYSQPRMTQHELKQFATARNVSKSQLDNFVERLQNLFNASYNDPDAIAEAKALRILHNHLDYRRLTPLCQAYVDPTASFAAPRTHYWRFTHHIHLDECITRGPDNVDLATAIDRMGRNFNRAMQTMNDNIQNNRRRDNDNRNRRDNDNRNRRFNNYNTSNSRNYNSNNRNSQRSSNYNSNNRSNNYRSREQRSSNNNSTSNNNSSRNQNPSGTNTSRNNSDRRDNNTSNNTTNNNNTNRNDNNNSKNNSNRDNQRPRINNINDDERTDNESYTPRSDYDDRSDDRSDNGNTSGNQTDNNSGNDNGNDSCNTMRHYYPSTHQYFH